MKLCLSIYKHDIQYSLRPILTHPRPISWAHDIRSLSSGKLTFQPATQRQQRSHSVVYMCSTWFSMRLRHAGDTVAFNPGSGIGRAKGPSGETVALIVI